MVLRIILVVVRSALTTSFGGLSRSGALMTLGRLVVSGLSLVGGLIFADFSPLSGLVSTKVLDYITHSKFDLACIMMTAPNEV